MVTEFDHYGYEGECDTTFSMKFLKVSNILSFFYLPHPSTDILECIFQHTRSEFGMLF